MTSKNRSNNASSSIIIKEEIKIPKISVGEKYLFEDNSGCYRLVSCICNKENIFDVFLY